MKYIFLVAMIAMIGISAATLDIQITNPEDGAEIAVGDTVIAKILLEATGEENISVRMLVDGAPSKTLAWQPTAKGEYVLTLQAANNPAFAGAASASTTITVYEPDRVDYAAIDIPNAVREPPATATKKAPPGIPKDSRDPAAYDPASSIPA